MKMKWNWTWFGYFPMEHAAMEKSQRMFDNPVMPRLIDVIITNAIQQNADRIQFEPGDCEVKVHFECRSQLLPQDPMPLRIYMKFFGALTKLCEWGHVRFNEGETIFRFAEQRIGKTIVDITRSTGGRQITLQIVLHPSLASRNGGHGVSSV